MAFFCPQCGTDRRALAPIQPCTVCGLALDAPTGAAPQRAVGIHRAISVSDTAEIEVARSRPRPRWILPAAAAVLVAGGIATTVLLTQGGASANASTPGPSSAAGSASIAPPVDIPPPEPPPPTWLLIQVDSVTVTSTRLDGTSWDGAKPEDNNDDLFCELVGIAGAALGDVTSGAASAGVCGLLTAPPKARQVEKDPRQPDLFISMRAGSDVGYRSPVVADTASHTFQYGFVVPTEGIPRAGPQFAVNDADGVDGHEQLGSMRIDLRRLLDAVRNGDVIYLSDGSVERMEIAVTEYDGTPRSKAFRPVLNKKVNDVEGVRVYAGEVVRVSGSGSYDIGRGQQIEARGYVGEVSRNSVQAEPMKSSSVGALYALVGGAGAVTPMMVAPCARMVAQYSGGVAVGINDKQVGDNKGDLVVKVVVRGPSVANWKAAGWVGGCPTIE